MHPYFLHVNILSAESLGKAFIETPLFEDVSISLAFKQKAALIAANGVGKTTLLRILAGKETADSGQVSLRNGTRLGYLEQEPALNENDTIKESLFNSDNPVMNCIGDYEFCLTRGDQADQHEMQRLMERMDELNAWGYEAKATEILGMLNIHDLDKQIKFLSGGQKKRLALAHLLIEEPDLFILDEPTNHLDLDMIEWLEKYLNKLNKTMLIVTHDRYFLDGVCDTIYELENGKMYLHRGNYAYFLEKKQGREFREGREIDKAANLFRSELEWMRRQPKARSTKQKARIDSFYETEKKANSAKAEDKMKITMQMTRMGSKILEFENVCKSYGDHVLFKDFSYTFKRGEKIGILGRNGCGKSTLLNIVMDLVKPDKGRVRTGETMVYGYYSQDGMQLKEDKRVIDVARDIAEYIDTGNGNWMGVSQFLNHFLFTGSKQHTLVSKLSGGEKRRLYLMTILLKNPNFLILDEPTNDLDIATLNLLEEFLVQYQGCMLIVTHDRYFMDRLVDHVFVFEGDGKIRDIHGNYSAYRELLLEEKQEKTRPVKAEKPVTGKSEVAKKKGLNFKEKKELEMIEKEIEILESRKKILLNEMADPSAGHIKLKGWADEFGLLEKHLNDKQERWFALSAMNE